MGIRLFGAVQGLKAQVQGMLLGLGTGGNAKASDVLNGKVVTVDAGQITGTMPNEGSVTLTPGPSNVPIPQGYHDGTGKVTAVVVPATNVLTGTTIAGTAGTMPNNGGVTITPGAASQTIPLGYHDGTGTVPAVVVPAANVLTGTTIAGTAGTMPNRGAVTITPGLSDQTIPAGYHNGSGTVPAVSVPAGNVLTGTTIAGTAGTMPNQGAPTFTPSTTGDTAISAGYYSGGTVKKAYPVGSMVSNVTVEQIAYSANPNSSSTGNGVAVDSQGNMYIVINAVLYKYNLAGSLVWSKSDFSYFSVFVDQYDYIYTNHNNSNIHKMDGSGNTIWNNAVGVQQAYNISICNSGYIYTYDGGTSTHPTRKHDGSGNIVWTDTTIGSNSWFAHTNFSTEMTVISADTTSSSIAIRVVNSSDALQWNLTASASGMSNCSGAIMGSDGYVYARNGVQLMKLNNSGGMVWSVAINDTYTLKGNIAIDNSNNIYIVEYQTGHRYMRINSSGSILWTYTASNMTPYAINTNLSGSYSCVSIPYAGGSVFYGNTQYLING
ncbi:hypothetical protein [Desulfosporosinus sp. SB140]|uniref:hypothetical protein n=1 Tax=Desulfosporosinus paludis TaxID=3115649 RepID=UPI00388FE297